MAISLGIYPIFRQTHMSNGISNMNISYVSSNYVISLEYHWYISSRYGFPNHWKHALKIMGKSLVNQAANISGFRPMVSGGVWY